MEGVDNSRPAPPPFRSSRIPGGLTTILLVDDDPEFSHSIRELYALEGVEVHLAASGDQAAGSFAANRPDLLLIDIMLPGDDGFEVLERLRSLPGGASVATVMITGHTMTRNEVEQRLGTPARGGFLAKPFDPGDLWAEIERLRRIQVEQLQSNEPIVDEYGAIEESSPETDRQHYAIRALKPLTKPVLHTGVLTTDSLVEVYAALVREAFSGRLTITGGSSVRTLEFHQGYVVHSSSPLERCRLCSYLVQEGLLTSDQRAQALRRAMRDRTRVGDAIVALGFAGRTTLEEKIATKISSELGASLSSAKGIWSREQFEVLEPEAEAPVVPASQILGGDLVLRLDHERAATQIQALGDTRLVMVDDRARIADRLPTDGPWARVCDALKEPATVGELFGRIDSPTPEIITALWVMVLMDCVGEAAPDQGEEKAAESGPRGPETPPQESTPEERQTEQRPQQPPPAEEIPPDVTPATHETYVATGLLALQRHDYARAERILRRAWHLAPESSTVCSHLGWAVFLKPTDDRESAAEEAVELLTAAIRAAPNDHEAAFRLANVYASIGRFDLAEDIHERLSRGDFPLSQLTDLEEKISNSRESLDGLVGWFEPKKE